MPRIVCSSQESPAFYKKYASFTSPMDLGEPFPKLDFILELCKFNYNIGLFYAINPIILAACTVDINDIHTATEAYNQIFDIVTIHGRARYNPIRISPISPIKALMEASGYSRPTDTFDWYRDVVFPCHEVKKIWIPSDLKHVILSRATRMQ
jgi:hypothetical protein